MSILSRVATTMQTVLSAVTVKTPSREFALTVFRLVTLYAMRADDSALYVTV